METYNKKINMFYLLQLNYINTDNNNFNKFVYSSVRSRLNLK